MIEYIGWLGVLLGLCVAPPQLWKIWRSKEVKGISTLTYGMLLATMICYLIHAINIGDAVFIVAYGFNLTINGIIFILMLRYREETYFWEDVYYKIGGR